MAWLAQGHGGDTMPLFSWLNCSFCSAPSPQILEAAVASKKEQTFMQLASSGGSKSHSVLEATGMCDEAGWVFLGLSIAEWSLVAFSSMTVVSIHAIFRRTQQTTIEHAGLASRI